MNNKIYSIVFVLASYFFFSEAVVVFMMLHDHSYFTIFIYVMVFIASLIALKIYVQIPVALIALLVIVYWGVFAYTAAVKALDHYGVDMISGRVKSNLILVSPKIKSYINLNNKCPNSLRDVLDGENLPDPFSYNNYIITQLDKGCLVRSVGPNKIIDKRYVDVLKESLPHYRNGSMWAMLYTGPILLYFAPSLGKENIDLGTYIESH